MSKFIFDWHTDCPLPVICVLNYEKASKGGSEYSGGPPIEPDEPESMTLESACVNGVEIYYLLDEKQIALVEMLALKKRNDS